MSNSTFEAIISQADMVVRLRKEIIAREEHLAELEDEIISNNSLLTNRQSAIAQAREDLAKEEARLVEAICAKPVAPPKWVKRKRVPYPKAKSGSVVWMGNRKELGVLQMDGRVRNPFGIFKCSKKDLWYPYPGEGTPVTGD